MPARLSVTRSRCRTSVNADVNEALPTPLMCPMSSPLILPSVTTASETRLFLVEGGPILKFR